MVATEEHVQGGAEEAAGDFAFVPGRFPVAFCGARMKSKTGYTRDNPVIRRIEEVVRSPRDALRLSKLPTTGDQLWKVWTHLFAKLLVTDTAPSRPQAGQERLWRK